MGKKYKYDIQDLCVALLSRERFYAIILSKMAKIPVAPSVCMTAGVSFNKHGKLSLFYNADWLLGQLSLREGIGLLIHEVLHIFFRHHSRFSFVEPCNRKRANVAMDMAINQLIDNTMLPPNPCLPGVKPFEKITDKMMGAEWYLNLFLYAMALTIIKNLLSK